MHPHDSACCLSVRFAQERNGSLDFIDVLVHPECPLYMLIIVYDIIIMFLILFLL